MKICPKSVIGKFSPGQQKTRMNFIMISKSKLFKVLVDTK
jgi:hypothetical protein